MENALKGADMLNRKYKICVYAICKNESAFVERWYESVRDADLVLVTDTGSDDHTVKRLRDCGAEVHEMKAEPFRFDVCRNYCMEFIPQDFDICISIDLDEVMQSGWRSAIEEAWQPDTGRGRYLFNWSLRDDGTPEVQYYYDRIHARKNYRWIYPTHEILEYTGEGSEKQTFIPGVVINHYPDKEKNRSFNLPLLRLAVEESGGSARNLHYLGREYMYAGMWQSCIDTLLCHLKPGVSDWDEERSASMRFIARAYGMLGNRLEQKRWLFHAIAETPFLREPYVEAAQAAYELGEWEAVYFFAAEALRIKEKSFNYANEIFAWDSHPYDLAAIASFRLGRFDDAVRFSELALETEPHNERLKENHKLYISKIQ